MKRIISLVLAVLMICSLCTAALADTAQFSSTAAWMKTMDSEGIYYTYRGIQDNGYEKITLGNSDSGAGIEYTVTYFFNEDGEEVSIRIWDFITFDAADRAAVMNACNQAELDWKLVRFVVEDDNTVTPQIDVILRNGTEGDVTLEATLRMVDIIGDAYTEYLKPFAK